MSKVQFGPENVVPHEDTGPWHSGWKGWEDKIEVCVDGRYIGYLDGRGGAPAKSEITYAFRAAPGSHLGSAIEDIWPTRVLPMGRHAAKALLREIVTKVNIEREG